MKTSPQQCKYKTKTKVWCNFRGLFSILSIFLLMTPIGEKNPRNFTPNHRLLLLIFPKQSIAGTLLFFINSYDIHSKLCTWISSYLFDKLIGFSSHSPPFFPININVRTFKFFNFYSQSSYADDTIQSQIEQRSCNNPEI